MTRAIWKFALAPAAEQAIDMPRGARLLTAREQGDAMCVWAEVDPAAPTERRTFRVVGTGHPLSERPMIYVGTAMPRGGDLVFHVYELAAAPTRSPRTAPEHVDAGQRFVVRRRLRGMAEHETEDRDWWEAPLFTDSLERAESLRRAWETHPHGYEVQVVDRVVPASGDAR